MPDDKPATHLFRCSFCLKPQTEVQKMVAGPGVFICDGCVALCVPIMAQATTPLAPESIMTPDTMPTGELLRILVGYNGAGEAIDTAMRDAVDVLRARDVSWAAIGETLGVSRQAAWKRFG